MIKVIIKRVLSALIQLEINPFIGKKLKGEYKNQWSLRVWPYRIIYEIADTQLIVLNYQDCRQARSLLKNAIHHYYGAVAE